MERKTAQEMVKDTRDELGLTQSLLAKKIGANSPQAFQRLVAAKNGMRTDNFVKLMNAMGYDVIVRNRVTDAETTIVESGDDK